jgi:PAS domain S-box-containing protein
MIGNRAVLDVVRDAIFLADAETGMLVDANSAAEQLTGWTVSELRSFHHTKLHPPERRELAASRFKQNLLAPALVEGVVLRKDGRRIPVEVASSTFAENGRRLLVGVFRDISERTAAQQRFQQIAESAGEFIWEVDAAGLYLYASPAVEQILGYAPDEIVGKMRFYDLFEPRTREELKALAFELFDRRGPFHALLNWNVRKDGRLVALETTGVPVCDANGNLLGYRGADTDVTERKRAQESLRDSESRARARAAELQAIMDAAPAVIIIAHDPECRQLGGNRTAYQLLRQAPGGSLLKSDFRERPANFRIMRNGVELQPEEGPLPTAVSTGAPVRNCELDVVFEDGASIHLLGNAEPMRDENGLVQGAVAVLSDITERKQAEGALRESEARFRNMADSAPVMIWLAGTDKLCTFFNKQWLDFTGRSLDRELGNGWAEGVHPDDLERCLATYQSSFDARRSFQMEYRLRRADGQYRWLLDTGTPLYREGEFAGYIGSCTDVTEQKLILERLRANEARLLHAQRLARVGGWEMEIATGKIRWSDEMFRIYGRPNAAPADFTELLSYIHPADRKVLSETDQKLSQDSAPVEMEYRIIRPDGEVRFLHAIVEAVRDGQGVPVRLLGATQDVTEHIRARQLLAENEERLKNAERIAHVGNWRWDIKGNRVFWSEELLRIFDVPANVAPGYDHFIRCTVPHDRERVERWVQDCFALRTNTPLEFQIARPNGEVRTVTSLIEVSVDESGSPVHLSGTCQDVTEHRRAQQEALARQKLESVGTLAGGIAHDFNNLLSGILAQSELALTELAAGSKPEEELRRIRDVAAHGSEIVRQLMIYAGTESEALEPVDVSRTVREMMDLLRVSISKHVVLLTDLADPLPAVRANAAQLRRIVMNLVTNASEAVGEGDGIVRVTTTRVAVGRTAAAQKGVAAGDYVQLEVSDTGRGIPLENLARVFDPFFTTKSTGRGLGLAVVDGIARSLGGTIQVSSEQGKGTTFRIWLPLAEGVAESAGPVPDSEEAPPPPREATVLIVEDEDALRQAVAKMLTRKGFRVLEAPDGSAAINLIRVNRGKIDALLLDMTIPGPSSRQVAAEAQQAAPNVKIILTSAYNEEAAVAAVGSNTVQTFIRKPFRLGQVVQALRTALSR